MWLQIGSIVSVGYLLNFIMYYRAWLHWDAGSVLTVRPGPCHAVQEDGGAEDIVHIGQGKFLASTGFGFGKLTGEISTIDTNGKTTMVAANLTNVPMKVDDFLASPHGMATWEDPSTGKLYLYVITHPKKEDRIEVFEVQTPYQLRYIKTITDPAFTYMNDIVVVDRDKFYITRYTVYRDSLSIQLEHLSHLRFGKILYYDGRRAREVSSGYFLPNGINISPDKKMIYVAEWGGQTLRGFRRERSNDIVQVWEKPMKTGIDNIDVDKNGDLWIGCHPVTWRIVDFWNIFGASLPSQAIRVKIRDGAVSDVEEIYADDGNECAGSTGAVYANGKLVVGTVSKQTVICDVNYLTE